MIVSLLLLITVLIGAPLFVVIGAGAIYNFYQSDSDLAVIAIEFYRLVDTPVLVSIPLFTFAGYLLSESHASKRLVRLSETLFGWAPGGLAFVALVTCAFFTALTGASGVTIIALGALLYPALRQGGYSDRFSLGLITSSGSLGLLFPPSLGLILYGVVAQQLRVGPAVSIDDLFLAGLLPGTLMLVLLAGWSAWQGRHNIAEREKVERGEAIAALRDAAWELPLPLVILGGIYGGILALSEAAAVAVLYVFVVECLIHREVPFRKLPDIMCESMVLVGAILIILGVSIASTTYLVDAEVPTKLFNFFQSHIDSPLTFLLALNIFLLALGMILDLFSALVIMVPLLLPIAVGYGIHPVHLGIIFLANMQIGYFTPPVGMNLFIASHRFNKPITELYMASLPFMLVLLAALAVITYWPALTLVLITP